MLKFKCEADKELLLEELKKEPEFASGLTLEDLNDPSIQSAVAVKRKRLVKKLKNFRRSQIQKQNWRKGKHKYLKGIRNFHKSMAGKKFHRGLARFVVSRGILKKPKKTTEYGTSSRLRETFLPIRYGNIKLNRYDQSELLTLLSATRNHLVLETRYYLPISEEVDHLLMLEVVLPELTELCTRLEDAIINYDDFLLKEEEINLIDSFLGSNYYGEFEDIEEFNEKYITKS
jgi:hypothetical protein